ncbi:NAD(P)/FAD-dependent oxidoreductase [Natronospira bacteriovora]|uniref:FAD-dependent oxidoreductase n=1 Tax=Natronospira bacteriovora TaxID=3069753 RepID=A0ABU0W880_9GAMM|nr:FAD-dependent oxidoreductase [Natronospira sp. AB-CW4]MDQ2070219.1 FAD-dependent oxidoreductase [Natronospira sp. AB-CW4]
MRIAVVGSGISGLGAAWLLSAEHEVVLYESATRFGGHTNTVTVREGDRHVPVDTGFIVFNDLNYPHLSSLFRHLGVASAESDMSFAASLGEGEIEYAGDNLLKLFAQPANLFRPSHWRMLADILKFNQRAIDWLDQQAGKRGGGEQALTLGQFLHHHGFGMELSERYLLPMAAAIWSAPMARILDFPAISFLRFFRNHGLLQVNERPQWRTVTGGGREYVRRLIEPLGDRAIAGIGVEGIRRTPAGVLVRDSNGHEAEYEQVVLASHADQSLALLEDADEQERRVLSAFRFQANRAWLHSDSRLMPRRRRVWASWNYLADRRTREDSRVAVSYWMNRLQPLASERNYFVTLNPAQRPDPAVTWHCVDYEHPVFDLSALRAQEHLPAIQGQRGLWFCGAWTAYGFHEDGLRSAVNVCNAMGVHAPWQQGVADSRRRLAPPAPAVEALMEEG